MWFSIDSDFRGVVSGLLGRAAETQHTDSSTSAIWRNQASMTPMGCMQAHTEAGRADKDVSIAEEVALLAGWSGWAGLQRTAAPARLRSSKASAPQEWDDDPGEPLC